ncbi:hypothetical protein RB195_006632 [Necator americanus]|uniref:CDT1 Geminin-binding domain-containing protein n=1 Tax=Necator americanus TaxID=51031 RepID=A0ABR1BWE7_NECAM
MSCRSTRSRAAKITLDEPVEHTRKITDVFKVTRGRARLQKKSLCSAEPVQGGKCLLTSEEIKQPSSGGVCSTAVNESVCSPPKRVKKSDDSKMVRSARKVLFGSQISSEELDTVKGEQDAESKNGEAFAIKLGPGMVSSQVEADVVHSSTTKLEPGVPSLTSLAENKKDASPIQMKSGKAPGVVEVVVGTVSSPSTKLEPDVVLPALNPLLTKADELCKKLSSTTAQSKTRARIRNVAELQAVLAQKECLKKIHEQSQRNRSKQVEEHAKLLKSPTKPTSLAIIKTKTVKDKRTEQCPHSVPKDIPEFVLPSHTKTEKDIEEFELDDKRHVFEYGKASRLVDEVKKNSALPLPLQYERLLETFQCCDRVVSIYTSQGRRCVVSEIQKNVEKNTQISFTRKNLAQIIHVYPTSYDVRIEKRWNPFGGESKCGKFDLIMAANLNDDLSGYLLPDSPVKADKLPLPTVTPKKLLSPRKKVVNVVPRDPVLDGKPRLEGWRMTCRCHVFRHKLVEIAKKFHKKFIERIGLSMSESEHSKLRRFHPKFDLDSECEKIPEAEIPDVPHDDVEHRLEMRDYFASVDTSVALPKAINTVIEELKSPVKRIVNSEASVPLSPRQFAEKQASKPKGAISLLERIRAKEAAKKAAESLRDPVVERKLEILNRILHGLLRCITTYFAFKKVRSMEMGVLSEQITRSQSSMNRSLILEHVTVLCEVASDCVALTDVAGKKYLQIKNNDYLTLEKLIQDEISRLRGAPPPHGSGIAIVKKPAVRALF